MAPKLKDIEYMKNHILNLVIFSFVFSSLPLFSHAEESGEDSSDAEVAVSYEAAQPAAEATYNTAVEVVPTEAEFSDLNPADPLSPLSEFSEPVQAGANAESIQNDMASNGVEGVLPLNYNVADDMYQTGYMAPGMDPLLTGMLVANSNVDALFKKYAALRSQRAIHLPEEFRSLVGYVMGYINTYSKKGTDSANGLANWDLAVHIVKASFCYGNDPFMLAAKVRAETSFNRTLVSSTGAVGFSQMTGSGIGEVKDQMSGSSRISMPNALRSFQMGARCYAGVENWRPPNVNNVEMKKQLRSSYRMDLSFGQIMMKAYVSYTKATGRLTSSYADIAKAYGAAFVLYNGDSQPTAGTCLGQKSVEMKLEYSCDIISYFTSMSTHWDRFMTQQRRRARENQLY